MNYKTYETLGDHAPSNNPALADAWVAFDFGDGGLDANNHILPGVANKAIADYLKTHVIEARVGNGDDSQTTYHPKARINAQVLVGTALMAMCPGIEKSDLFQIIGEPRPDDDYIDSWKVANEARQQTPWARTSGRMLTPEQQHRRAQGLSVGRVAVAAVAQHAGRAAWQTQRAYWTTAEDRFTCRICQRQLNSGVDQRATILVGARTGNPRLVLHQRRRAVDREHPGTPRAHCRLGQEKD